MTSPKTMLPTVRPSSFEPVALLVAVVPSPVLLATATTAFAVTRPLRISTCSTVALLRALADVPPIEPVVVTVSVCDARVWGMVMLATWFEAVPPPDGRTTSGVFGIVTLTAPTTFTETP
jgi:hypothetical protein